MLLFEFFPAFVAMLSIGIGVWLYLVERRARQESGPPPPPRSTNRPSRGTESERPGGRPSMRG